MKIGFLLFPDVLQMDFTGPYGVLAEVPNNEFFLISQTLSPIYSSDKLVLTPTITQSSCPPLDILLVPGGSGVESLLEDDKTLDFLREQAKHCRYVCSICTGALVLGAAGLLKGRKATTFWQYTDLLSLFGAEYSEARYVHDGNIVTAAGVSSGIDMALFLVSLVWGEKQAREVQLGMEYQPAPPFSGSPKTALPETVSSALKETEQQRIRRKEAALRAVKKLA